MALVHAVAQVCAGLTIPQFESAEVLGLLATLPSKIIVGAVLSVMKKSGAKTARHCALLAWHAGSIAL